MSETLAPLWSKSRIYTVTHSYSTYIVADNIRCMSKASAFILMMEMCKDYEAERQRLSADHAALVARIAELEALIAYIDKHAPLSDETCVRPGITLSEAARAQMMEDKNHE